MKLLHIPLLFFLLVIASCSNDDDSTVPPAIIEITAEDFAATIEENPSANQVLGTVNASIRDGQVTFTIKSQEPPDAMTINAATGELTVADPALFDFETKPVLTAMVEVSANGANTKEVDASITLTDVVETIDITAQDFATTIDENPNADQALGAVIASVPNGEVTFAIKIQNPSNAIVINAVSGELTVANPAVFDYETNPTLEAVVEISAENAASVTKDVTITLNNLDDLAFITTWETTTDGESITIPVSSELTYEYTIDWGDGNIQSGITGNAIHTYNDGELLHTVSISGTFPAITFNDVNNGLQGDRDKIVSIDQWGDIKWQSMNAAFSGCRNLTYNATDAPDLSQVTDMSLMFSSSSFNGDINSWDVGNVTDMGGMFANASSFNQDLGGWDVGNVTDMGSMFLNSNFNQDIGGWDVSNVTDMGGMFTNASSFNQGIGEWDVGSVTDMWHLFNGASSFNQDISSWDVTNVTDMAYMFANNSSFNQNLGSWDIGSINTMENMLSDSGLSKENYSATLVGWKNYVEADNGPTGITLGAEGLNFCTEGLLAWATLTNAPFNWTIDDDGYETCN